MTSGPDFGVDTELTLVGDRIREAIRSEEPLLTDIAAYVIEAGGKRIRPMVALLANKAVGGKNLPQTVQIAAALELIHSATLLHDDINDSGLMRRGREAAYKKFGLQNALVAGDFLFVKAFQIGGKFEPEIVDLTARVCTSLAEAEIVQKRQSGDLAITRAQYLNVVMRKTAMPISAGARIGALLGGGTPEEVEALTSYGLHLGTAFQIVDDILDVIGEPAVLGKPVGTDDWMLKVFAGGTLLAAHSFGWQAVGGGDIQRYVETDGEIGAELQQAMRGKPRQAVSLADLLGDQEER